MRTPATQAIAPRSGAGSDRRPTRTFSSLAEHDALAEPRRDGRRDGGEPGLLGHEAPQKLETVEIRVCDVCSSTDEAVMLPALPRSRTHLPRSREEEKPYPEVRPEILRAAHWVASRYGLGADLVDVEAGHLAPAKEVIEKLLPLTRRALEEHGDWEEVSVLVGDTLKRGNGAVRQCQVCRAIGKARRRR